MEAFFFFFQFRRINLWIQRPDTCVWIVPSVRNAIDQSETDQRFSLCWHEHLQCGGAVSDNSSGGHGHCIATGRIVCIYGFGRDILLFSQHVAYICAKGKCEAAAIYMVDLNTILE